MDIKDFLPKQASLCEYIWKVVVCIVITSEGYSSLNIWPKILNQDTSTENIIFTI